MRAIEVTRFGGPEVLVRREVPDPTAGDSDIVIDVSYVDTIFLDTQLRRGAMQEFFQLNPPYIPGDGVAGRVIRVGNDADRDLLGQTVVALTHGVGAYAEQAVAPADQVVPLPDGLDPAAGAALVHDGRTAYALTESTGIQADEIVLILAAAGGMGSILVQLALARNAHVVGAARGEHKLAAIRALGTDAVVDYSEPNWLDDLLDLSNGRGPDVVFDGVGGELGTKALRALRPGGRFSAHGASSGRLTAIRDEQRQRGVMFKGIEQAHLDPSEGRRLTADALSDALAGKITPHVGLTLTLERASDAHQAIESRAVIGKTLLQAANYQQSARPQASRRQAESRRFDLQTEHGEAQGQHH